MLAPVELRRAPTLRLSAVLRSAGAADFSGFRTKMPTSMQSGGRGVVSLVGCGESRSPKVHINSGISFLPSLLGWLFALPPVLWCRVLQGEEPCCSAVYCSDALGINGAFSHGSLCTCILSPPHSLPLKVCGGPHSLTLKKRGDSEYSKGVDAFP